MWTHIAGGLFEKLLLQYNSVAVAAEEAKTQPYSTIYMNGLWKCQCDRQVHLRHGHAFTLGKYSAGEHRRPPLLYGCASMEVVHACIVYPLPT